MKKVINFIIKYNKYFIGALISIGILIVDQISKQIVFNNKELLQSTGVTVIKDFFYLTYSVNYGAINGALQGRRIVLVFITIAALGIFGYLFKFADFKRKKLYTASLILVVGGALGNFHDRIFRDGGVIDFISTFPIGRGHDWFLGNFFSLDPFPTYNIADCCLTIGVILLAINIIFFEKEDKEKNSLEEEVISDGNN